MVNEKFYIGEEVYSSGLEAWYVVTAINEKLDRVLLVAKQRTLKEKSNRNKYVGVWGLQKIAESDCSVFWVQGHYYGDDFLAASEYVAGKEPEPERKISYERLMEIVCDYLESEEFSYGESGTVVERLRQDCKCTNTELKVLGYEYYTDGEEDLLVQDICDFLNEYAPYECGKEEFSKMSFEEHKANLEQILEDMKENHFEEDEFYSLIDWCEDLIARINVVLS